MPEPDQEFAELVARIRSGDQQAAADFVRQYEPEVRRVVRFRLTDQRLRRVIDSVDVCQSVFANFFVRVWAGQFELKTADDLFGLLVTMARNKVLDQARRFQALGRDARRQTADGEAALQAVAGTGPSPEKIASDHNLLDEVRRRLSPEERYLAEQRALDREWSDLAVELGASADALRKQLSRALDRVTQELGLKEIDDA